MLKSRAKNFVLIPTQFYKALVIRRGPAKRTGVFSWNLKNDEIKSYQWLKGRIYEYFSDISPDGIYFLYSANRKGNSYTVLSQAPWLKALSLWNNVGGYGGGLLNTNDSYMLYDGSETYNSFRTDLLNGVKGDWDALKYGVYPARLARYGWSLSEKSKGCFKFLKKLSENKSLVKLWHRKIPSVSGGGVSSLWESHQLIVDDIVIQKEGWEWCDVYDNQLLWSEKECIYRALTNNSQQINEPVLIYTQNHWKHE